MVMTVESTSDRLRGSLAQMGFTRSRRGEAYRHNGVMFQMDGPWSYLQTSEPLADADPLAADGLRGLWKHIITESGSVRRIFDVPTQLLSPPEDPDEAEEQVAPLQQCLDWALATSKCELPAGWSGPSREEVDGWLPSRALVLQDGPILRQGILLCTPEHLALRFPIVPSVCGDLSENRRAWLRELLIDAQNRWRLVRIVWQGNAIHAEVDLSGAPAVILEPLFRTGLDALRWVVSWLVRSAVFLADTSMVCRAVEVCPVRAAPAERRVSP